MNNKERLKKIEDTLNLKKRYPGYFHIWVFYLVLIILVFIMIYAGHISGWQMKNDNIYVCCPANAINGYCEIPSGAIPYINDIDTYKIKNYDYIDPFLKDVEMSYNYSNEQINLLLAGVCIGEKPPFVIKNFWPITIIFVLIGFSFNHWLYVRNQRKIIKRRVNR